MVRFDSPGKDPDSHGKCESGPSGSVADPLHLGTNPDPRIRTSDERIRMRIREAQKHKDPEHRYIYIIL